MLSRQAIRTELRRQRQLLSLAQQRAASQFLLRRISRLPAFLTANRIGCYLANDGEIDLSVILERIQRMNKRCYLPVLDPGGSKRLWFAPYDDDQSMQINQFGIAEPLVSPRQYLRAAALDMLLVPLVAFDRNGNRLGMGGGFYDKTLAYFSRRQYWRKPFLLGVAHDFQRVDALEQAAWDIPLHAIITDQSYYKVSAR